MRAADASRSLAPVLGLVVLAAFSLGCAEENRLPAMERIGDRSVRVGDTLEVVVRAEDPDGDSVTFYILGKPAGAEFYQSADTATLLWSPSITDAEEDGKDYPLTVTVQDSAGAWVSQEFTVTVFPQGGVPVFLNPRGYVLNLAETDYVTFRIEVKDDDTTSDDLEIRLHRGIEGSVFRVEEPKNKTAVFYWEPSPEQIAERSVYSLLVGADDGVHEEVLHEMALILLHPEAARDCPGQPPTLQHTPPPDQRDAGGYAVLLRGSDPESEVRFPSLFWAIGASPDPSAFRPLAMTADEDTPGTFRAFVPPLEASVGAGIVSYFFTASDNDDLAADRCDHGTRLPKSGHFAFAAYAPGTSPDLCLQDDLDLAAPNDTQETATSLPGGTLRGLRLCPGDTDWFATAVGAGIRATYTLHHVAAHGELDLRIWDDEGLRLGSFSRFGNRTVVTVPPAGQERVLYAAVEGPEAKPLTYGLDMELSQTACEDDEREPDDEPGAATVVPTPGFTFRGGTVCAGDPDWFRITTAGGQHLTVTLDISPLDGDLDVAIVDTDGETELARVERVGEIHEELSLNVVGAGTYYVLVYSPEGTDGVYDLEIQLLDQTFSCQDDMLAPNQSVDRALMLPASTFDELVLCPGRPDWFQMGLNGGETLHLAALADEESTRFGLTVFDADGATLGAAESDAGWAELSTPIPSAGDYTFRVRGDEASAAHYSLEFSAEEPAGPGCTEDRFSPNHTAGGATVLPADAGVLRHIYTTQLKICGGLEDWFRFEAPANSPILVAVGYPSAGGTLGLDVFAERDLTAPAASSRDPALTTQWVDFAADSAGGVFFIRVSGPGVANQRYDLGVIVD